jgi:PAS domain S-box-containing protein
MYARDISEQQRIETALWESESKYRQLFEASSSPTVVFDANSQQFFDVNHAAIDLYGYTKEEWLRMSTEDVSAESVKKRSAFGGSGKKVQIVPLRWHKKKDETVFPVEIATGSSYLFQGRSLVCATLRDITERKAHEEALRKEKDFVDTLVQASPAFFFAINPDGKTRMVNKAMLTALDYSLDEVIGEDFLTTFISEEERSAVSVEFDNLIKTMRPSLMENHIVTKLEKQVLVEWHSRAVVKADGTLDFLFGVGVDVTERKEAQGHLQLFRSMFEASQEAISIGDSKGNLIYTNTAHEKLFGYTFKESTTINFRDFYPAESLDIWEGQVTPTLIQGKTWEGEFDVVDNEGNVFSIWERADAIRDSEGNILFKFCFMHDISERQQTWETLHRQWEEQQMILNTVPAMVWYRDRNNHLLRTNTLAAQTFKENEAQIASYTDCEEIIRLNKPQLKIVRAYQDANGVDRWMRIDKIPCWNNHGDLVGIIIFAIDVTEDKQMQTALSQESAEYMNIVVDNMPVMLTALDAGGHIVYWNHACEKVTGYRTEEMIGNEAALIRLFSKQTDHQNILKFPETSATEDMSWESSIICRDGKTKTIAWRSVCQHHPVPGWHVWHIGQDITQHKQLERLSRETRSLLPQVLELSKLGICLTDDRGRILQINQAFAEFYGFKSEELVGQRFTAVLPASIHDEEVREYYSLLLKQNEPILIKQRHDQHRNGQDFTVQVMASRVILEDKRRVLLSFISKLSDIKQLK